MSSSSVTTTAIATPATRTITAVAFAMDNDGTEARIRSMLEDAVSPLKKPKLSSSYRERLKSFSTLTYFGKPIAISPVVCAALGWRNIGIDLLECTYCKAKLCVLIDPKTSVSSLKQLINTYQNQLSHEGHALGCWFATTKSTKTSLSSTSRSTIEVGTCTDAFEGTTPATTASTAPLPLYLSAVLDPDVVLLFEHPTPSKLLLDRVTKRQQQAQTQNNSSKENSNAVHEEQQLEHVEDDKGVLTQVCTKLAFDSHDNLELSQKRNDFLKVLFGWDSITSESSSSSPMCRLCLACLEKRSSVLLIVVSHKYYCPYRCGITSLTNHQDDEETVPLWKVICSRILAEPTNNVDDEGAEASIARILAMIQESS